MFEENHRYGNAFDFRQFMDFAFEIEAIDVNHNNKKVAFAIEIFYRYVIKN